MAYYAAIQYMIDAKKNSQTLPDHIDYLDQLAEEGKIFSRGPFTDGSGGMIIYIADDYEEALELAGNDPHIIGKSRSFDLKEWGLLEKDIKK